MTGSIQEKNGKYYTVLNIKDKNGKYKKKWQTTGLPVKGNKRKAEQILRRRIAEYETNQLQTPKNLSFADWMRFTVESKKNTVAPTTYNGYCDMVRLHIAPYFEERRVLLTELTAGALEAYYLKKLEDGLSPNTIHQHHALIHTALKKALKLEYVQKNVAELADTPKRAKKDTPTPYNEAELIQLLNVFREDVLFYVVTFAVLFGLRRSEILGLRWDRIDFESGILRIDTTALRCMENGRVTTKICDTTKTETSCREFQLTEKEIALFRDLKERQAEYQRFFKKEYSKEYADFVFLDEKGVLLQPDYVTHHFKRVLRKNNLREIRFHDLRHSCATFLLYSDFNLKDIQEWLGHAQYQFTADTYIHADKSMKRKIAERMDHLLPDVSFGCQKNVRNDEKMNASTKKEFLENVDISRNSKACGDRI